jgi:hypothetical protein
MTNASHYKFLKIYMIYGLLEFKILNFQYLLSDIVICRGHGHDSSGHGNGHGHEDFSNLVTVTVTRDRDRDHFADL